MYNDNFGGGVAMAAIFSIVVSLILGVGTLGFIGWVVIKLMQHFGII